jgi:hypothetical protein
MHSHHTSPIPGERMPRKKPGFKTRNDKDYFCRLGKKLIHRRTLIPKDTRTSSEFGSFGKVKTSWKGIAKHDDTVMACLNISRFYEEPEYSDWLYDFLEDLPDSPEKRYVMELLQEPYDSDDLGDDMFASLYLNEERTEMEKIKEIFNNTNYRPHAGVSFRN